MNDDLTQTIDEFVQDVEEEEQMDKQGEPTDSNPPPPSTRGVVRGGGLWELSLCTFQLLASLNLIFSVGTIEVHNYSINQCIYATPYTMRQFES